MMIRSILCLMFVFTLAFPFDSTAMSLMRAVRKGDMAKVQELVNGGRSVNETTDETLMTPLIIAAHKGHLDIVKYLVSKGADIDAENAVGMSALLVTMASVKGNEHDEIAKYLIDQNADTNVQDQKYRRTPLMLATLRNNKEMVTYLLQNCVDTAIKDKQGKTALRHAQKYKELANIEAILTKSAGLQESAGCGKETAPILVAKPQEQWSRELIAKQMDHLAFRNYRGAELIEMQFKDQERFPSGFLNYPAALAEDEYGNIYLAGYTYGLLNGVIKPDYQPENRADMFLVKFDRNGSLLWKKQLGDYASDKITVLMIDGNALYIAGSSEEAFGNRRLTEGPQAVHGKQDMFIARLTLDGDLVWSDRYGTKDHDVVTAMVRGESNTIYLAGVVKQRADGIKSADPVLLKYDLNGNRLWDKNIGGQYQNDSITSIATDRQGAFYVTGRHRLNRTGQELYLSKFDPQGNQIWKKHFGLTKDLYETGYDKLKNKSLEELLEIGDKVKYSISNASDHSDNPFKEIFETRKRIEYTNHVTIGRDGGLYLFGSYYFYCQQCPKTREPEDIEAGILMAKFNSDGTMIFNKAIDEENYRGVDRNGIVTDRRAAGSAVKDRGVHYRYWSYHPTTVQQDADGNFHLVGYKATKLTDLHKLLLEDLGSQRLNHTTVVERYREQGYEVLAGDKEIRRQSQILARTLDNDLKNHDPEPFLAKISADGELIYQGRYQLNRYTIPKAMTLTRSGELLISGTNWVKDKQQERIFLKKLK